jgi:hypothetical protein
MAIIFSYPVKSTANNNDLILISDSQDSNQTKQIKVSSIVDQSLSLTTTGVSGLATLIDNVLNIPNYTQENAITFSGTTATGLVTRGASATQASVSSTIKSFGNSIFFNSGSNTGIQHDGLQTFKIGDTGGVGDSLAFYTKTFQRLRITSQGALVLGTGTTNYGTLGQALVSQADAPPTWQTMPSKIFSTIKVSGQTDVSALSTDDNLTLVAGANTTLLTNPTLRTVTISSTGAGGGGTTYDAGNGLNLNGTTFSTDLKTNGGLVIELEKLAVDLAAESITGLLTVAKGGTSNINSGTLHSALIGTGEFFDESADVQTAMMLPAGNTSRRPAANSTNVGLIRYNSQTTNFEVCKESSGGSGQYAWYTINVTIIP